MRTTRGWITSRGVPGRRLRSHISSAISCLCALLLAACQGSIAPRPPITIGYLMLAQQPRLRK